jgi:peptidoglycan/LPS O-acetylase OafA/YrhL
VGVILFYVGSGFILIGALRLPESNSLPLKFLGLLGAASYSIYLWHIPVGNWGWPVVRNISGLDGFPFYFCVYVIGSCLFGLVMSRLVEFPVLRIRNLLFPSPIRLNSSKPGDSKSLIVENAQAAVQLQIDYRRHVHTEVVNS